MIRLSDRQRRRLELLADPVNLSGPLAEGDREAIRAALRALDQLDDRAAEGFRALVAEMREVQRESFDRSRRKPDTVRRAKALEKRVDAALAPDPEPTLF